MVFDSSLARRVGHLVALGVALGLVAACGGVRFAACVTANKGGLRFAPGARPSSKAGTTSRADRPMSARTAA